jgi:pimeloyl-ACP methyl ester carboxylesterase/quercetin dioxygenase-like cupin family protein
VVHSLLSQEFAIVTPLGTVAGTLVCPRHPASVCVVLVGGTLSQDRDGFFRREGVPVRDAIKRIAEPLGAGGVATMRYDMPNQSVHDVTYSDQARILTDVVAHAREELSFCHVVIAGESAGAYVACLAAMDHCHADGYIFLGPLCSSSAEMYEYNFGRLLEYAESSPDRMGWARRSARRELAIGRHFRKLLEAAARGDDTYEIMDGDASWRFALAQRREELQMPPDEQFRWVQAPALALAGACDRNVPSDHSRRAVEIMKKAGNKDATALVLDGVDHSFQSVPEDQDEQLRERFSFASFRRPYDPRLYREMLAWIHARFPSAISNSTRGSFVSPCSDHEPERIHLAPGITIIDDLTCIEKTAGVDTLEGRIGPLLLAESSQAHFIDMPPGMFVAEHPHSTESIIYTVRGRWVLCSRGRRHVMTAGSLFHFARNIPTGYEVPFADNAFILIFKGERISESERQFIEYLRGLAARLVTEQANGIPYRLCDLPKDHPAREFARQLNPESDAGLLEAIGAE